MTMNDGLPGLPADLNTDPFLVVAWLHGTLLQVTAGGAVEAAAIAEYWRRLDAAAVDWFLRADLEHPKPVLLFTRLADDDVVHATELAAGKPVSSHTVTCCGTALRADVMQVCTPDMAKPCHACLTVVRTAGLFSAARVDLRGSDQARLVAAVCAG